MSQAALDLLAASGEEPAAPRETPAQRSIALLTGEATPAPAKKKPSGFAMPAGRGQPTNVDIGAAAGRIEAAASAVTGAAGTAVGGLQGMGDLLTGQGAAAADDVKWWQQALTYQPRTPEGQGSLESLGAGMAHPANPLAWPGIAGEFAGGAAEEAGWGPGMSTVMRMGPEAAAALLGTPATRGAAASLAADARAVTGAARRGAETLADVAEPAAAAEALTGFGGDSASAARASQMAARPNASPELVADLRSQMQRGPLNPEAVDRQLDADALPIRMRLTEGQASGDVEIASREFNAKGKDPEIAQRFNTQNQQLIDNLDEFRREVAPQAVGHDPVQNGQSLVDAYKGVDEVARQEIAAAYKAAREANGGDLEMNAESFISKVDAAKNAKAKFLPAEISAELGQWREGAPMNLEQFEDFRTTLANASRKAERAGDGNAVHAISVVRDALEDMDLTGSPAKNVKALFDEARALARKRFDRMNPRRATYDPAYKAAVDDPVEAGESSALADNFVQKYVVGGKRAHVERMVNALSGDDLAAQTLRAAPFNYMKHRAGIDPYKNTGEFSQAGYNKALAELTPKLDMLVGPEMAENAQLLGRVASSVKQLPSGNFANRSHTFVAQAADAAKGLAERSANTLIGGNIVPVGSWAREKLDARTAAKESRERLRPAAGTLAKEKKP